MVVRSWRQRLGVALVCVGFVSGVLGVLAPAADADHEDTALYVPSNPKCDKGQEVLNIQGVPIDGHTYEGTFDGTDWEITTTNVTSSSFDWDATGVTIGKVIVKAADGANVYSYDPPAVSGDDLRSPHTSNNDPAKPIAQISHVSFCFGAAGEQPAEGTLEVAKNVVNNVGDPFDETVPVFTFDVSCTGSGAPVTFDDQTVSEGSPWTSPSAIPAGYECTVTEDTGANPSAGAGAEWGTPSYSPSQTVTILDDLTVSVTIENPRDATPRGRAGLLEVRKNVVNNVGDAFDETVPLFTFDVSCTGSGAPVTFDDQTVSEGSPWTSPSAIPEGYECTVTEDTGANPSAGAGAEWGTPSYSPSPTVTVIDQQTVAVTITNPRNATGGTGGGGPGPQAVTGPLVITKAVAGVPAGTAGIYTFTFAVDCTDNAFDGATTITGDGSTTFHAAVPQGVTCTVTETDINPAVSGDEWATTVTDSDGAADGTVTITDATGESVTFTNTRTEVAGVVVERPAPPQPAPQPAPAPAPAPAPEVLPRVEERGAVLARTGFETGDLMVVAAIALFLGGLLVGWSHGADRRSPARVA